MFKKLEMLGRQVCSLDGANLEISVASDPIFFKEIKAFIANYDSTGIQEHLFG